VWAAGSRPAGKLRFNRKQASSAPTLREMGPLHLKAVAAPAAAAFLFRGEKLKTPKLIIAAI
jgi:hypothetical protein